MRLLKIRVIFILHCTLLVNILLFHSGNTDLKKTKDHMLEWFLSVTDYRRIYSAQAASQAKVFRRTVHFLHHVDAACTHCTPSCRY